MTYSTNAMTTLWSDKERIKLWARVEVEVLRAQAELQLIPTHWVGIAEKSALPSLREIKQCEYTSKHEVVAFLDAWGLEHVHIGMTSSDLVDTALAVRLVDSTDILLRESANFVESLRDFAIIHQDTLRVGRTHGQDATVDSLGHRFADFAFMALRAHRRLARARHDVSFIQVSGPTGTYAAIPRQVEESVAHALGLAPSQSSTQILARDSLAHWAACVAGLVDVVAAVALEVRLMSHSALAHTKPPKQVGQKGSSAMPHKRNPILAERLCGLARIARSSVNPLTEGISQWHERDIAHSSVERTLVPQLVGVAHYALLNASVLIDELEIDKNRLEQEIESTMGLVYSHNLLAAYQYTHKTPRSRAHELVEEICSNVPSSKPTLPALFESKYPRQHFKDNKKVFSPNIHLEHLWAELKRIHEGLVRPEREK